MNTYMILDGYPVLIDDRSVDGISKYSWVAVKNKNKNSQGRVYFHRYVKTENAKVCRQYLHRFLTGCPAEMYVDHINRNTLDCRTENLRIVTHHENMVNRSMQSNNTSGVIGVRWIPRIKRWQARMVVNKKEINLGHFADKHDAIEARRQGEVAYGYDKIRSNTWKPFSI